MKIIKINFIVALLSLSGCATNFYKSGASDQDFRRDIAMAEGHAASVIQDSTVMPAQSGLESLGRAIAIPMMKRRIVNDYMKSLGWEKQTKGFSDSNSSNNSNNNKLSAHHN